MKTPAKNKNTNAEPIGRLGLIQELKDGRIAQVSLTESQSIALQEFVNAQKYNSSNSARLLPTLCYVRCI